MKNKNRSAASTFAAGFFVGLLFMTIPMLEIKKQKKLTNELYEEAKHDSMVYRYNFEICKSMLNKL